MAETVTNKRKVKENVLVFLIGKDVTELEWAIFHEEDLPVSITEITRAHSNDNEETRQCILKWIKANKDVFAQAVGCGDWYCIGATKMIFISPKELESQTAAE